VPPQRSNPAGRRLLGALIALLLLGCVSGALVGTSMAMASPCPPQASHTDMPSERSVAEVPTAVLRDQADADTRSCSSDGRCLPARSEAGPHVPVPLADSAAPAGVPLAAWRGGRPERSAPWYRTPRPHALCVSRT
jgi:hypothetical protein